MAAITIYTRKWCSYCTAAKELLQKKGVAFDEIGIDGQPELRRAMIAKAGGSTSVPQIFIDGRHVGGCDNLYALEARGGLDPLLLV